ncbi:DeoR/GlpR family transcriptional regulator [Rhizobium viscosum]|uniref:DeoR family glycerol-3-phosphate regulon repressor n=1 Tax=Rhizobium viscosum TaxID=1673 RepID=A0ABR9IUQ3_RHIVS|nr:DeoR/GlpR family DNA-binding transcription regulator [Rhizobium viscosum]MBE1506925.1 DeoR family glycerol-3-phosphate regulon repressor [Rhizobium viscosum]
MHFADNHDDGGKKERRQDFLIRYLEQYQYISLDDIVSLCSVTAQTARRDIMALERQGKLRRTHGGAVISLPIETGIYHQRRVNNAEAKRLIANKIAELLPDNCSVFIDTGTTCEAVARALTVRRNLRVVTYSLRVATTLSENTDFTIAVPGGFIRNVDAAVFSENAQNFIRAFKFDYVIISVSGVDNDGDIGDDDYAEVSAVRAAMGQAARVILAVDSTKFERRALVRLGSISEMDIVVSEAKPSEKLLSLLNGSKTVYQVATTDNGSSGSIAKIGVTS